MKKTLLIIVAALSTSFVFGQNVTKLGLKGQFPDSEKIVKTSTTPHYFNAVQAPAVNKGSFTKSATVLMSCSFTEAAFRDSLKFGVKKNDTLFTGKTPAAEAQKKYSSQWFWVGNTDTVAFGDARTVVKGIGAGGTDSIVRRALSQTGYSCRSDYFIYTGKSEFAYGFKQGDTDHFKNGFAIITTLENLVDSNRNNYNDYYNSWIELPAFTTKDPNIKTVVVEFLQFHGKMFHREFIDFSTDDWHTYDSIEIGPLANYYGISDAKAGFSATYLPASVLDQDSVRIRFRTEGQSDIAMPWIIDEVRVTTGIANDLVITDRDHKAFYYEIPTGLPVEEIHWAASLQNRGNTPYTDVQGFVRLHRTANSSVVWEAKTKSIGVNYATDVAVALGPIDERSEDAYGGSITHAIPTATAGTYFLTQEVVADGTKMILDTVRGLTVRSSDGNGVWARDNYVHYPGKYTTMSALLQNGQAVSDPYGNSGASGYGVFLEYRTGDQDPQDSMYINAVQVVLDAYTKPNTMTNRVSSARPYVIVLHDNGDGTFDFSDVREGRIKYPEAGDISTDREARTFNMELDTGILIQKNTTYLVGYKLPSEGAFYVAANPYIHGVNNIISGSKSVYLPLQGVDYDQYLYFPTSINTPMVRAFVGKTQYFVGINTPKEINFELSAYPNPAIDFINISYTLEKPASKVSVEIYDILGRLVKVQDMNAKGAGTQKVRINTNDLKAGTYIYTLNVDGLRQSNKFIVTK